MNLLVNVDVNDLPRGIAFYQQAIGLQVGRRFGSFAVEMLGASSAVYLLLKPDGTRPSAEADDLRRYRRHWTPIHLDFVVPDIAAAVTRAIDAGATMEGEIRTHSWGRIAQMADPFGHGMCFIQFLGRGYDEIADRGEDGRPPGSADVAVSPTPAQLFLVPPFALQPRRPGRSKRKSRGSTQERRKARRHPASEEDARSASAQSKHAGPQDIQPTTVSGSSTIPLPSIGPMVGRCPPIAAIGRQIDHV